MAYQAFEKMRLLNRQRFGKDTGPFQPGLSDEARTGFDLKSAVSRFLHERCENLLFDGQIEEEEERSGIYRGTSFAPNQIPYTFNYMLRLIRRFDGLRIYRFAYDNSRE